jgi:hypothetical protein
MEAVVVFFRLEMQERAMLDDRLIRLKTFMFSLIVLGHHITKVSSCLHLRGCPNCHGNRNITRQTRFITVRINLELFNRNDDRLVRIARPNHTPRINTALFPVARFHHLYHPPALLFAPPAEPRRQPRPCVLTAQTPRRSDSSNPEPHQTSTPNVPPHLEHRQMSTL